VASGKVADIIGDSPSAAFDVGDPEAAVEVLGGLSCVTSVAREAEATLVVEANGPSRAEAVAALVTAGIAVERVVPRRRLEDAFLALVGGDTKASGERQ
jgi:ABC-2 type transport system ATP-binding protein